MNRSLAAVALSAVALSAGPAWADSVTDKVIAHDRVAHRIVLEDKTVYTYDPAVVSMPDTVAVGDEVTVDFKSAGDDGMVRINSVKIVAKAGGN